MDQESPPEQKSSSSDPILRTRILIIALVLVVALLLIFAIASKNTFTKPPMQNPSTSMQKPTYVGHTTISITPSSQTVSSSGAVMATIDTGGDLVTAVQLELQYDPASLNNVNITLPTSDSFFANPIVLSKKINTTTGRISYLLGLPPSEKPKPGKGSVAVISFQTLKSSGQTQISFAPKSLVTAQGVDPSVLKTTVPATIILFAK